MKLILKAREGDVIHLAWQGSMTQMPAGGHLEAVRQVVGADCHDQTVLFDLARVDYMDSSGISWVLVLHSRFVEGRGRLVLHSATPRVCATFDLLHLGAVLTLAGDVDAARALVGGQTP
jgi:anti-anti-sigma factor